MDEAQERKCAKYQELTEECRRRGWATHCEPVEVGCQGFAGHSLCTVWTELGIVGLAKKRAIKSTIHATEIATRGLWLKAPPRGLSSQLLLGCKLGSDFEVMSSNRPVTPSGLNLHG